MRNEYGADSKFVSSFPNMDSLTDPNMFCDLIFLVSFLQVESLAVQLW